MRELREVDLEDEQAPEINISPLIDMVFLLLIFFMVTTAFVEQTGVDIDKPRAVSAGELEKKSILLAVTAQGRVMHGGQKVGIEGVRGLVSRLMRQEKRPVIIVTDRNASAGLVVNVIDECKLAGADKVSIAAEKE